MISSISTKRHLPAAFLQKGRVSINFFGGLGALTSLSETASLERAQVLTDGKVKESRLGKLGAFQGATSQLLLGVP